MKQRYQIQFMNASFDPRTRLGTLLSGTSRAVWSFRPILFPYFSGAVSSQCVLDPRECFLELMETAPRYVTISKEIRSLNTRLRDCKYNLEPFERGMFC